VSDLETKLWQETTRLNLAGLPFITAVQTGTCPMSVLQAWALDLTTMFIEA
jgi:hypothetical protein